MQEKRSMPKPSKFEIQKVTWHHHHEQLINIRQQVFIDEQQVPVSLEWDGMDEAAIHLLALDQAGNAIGCARILNEGSIGRMAVLAGARGQGAGMALLLAALEICKQQGWHDARLSAQTHAIGFYQRAGFVVCSAEYPDAGIPHVDMKLKLLN